MTTANVSLLPSLINYATLNKAKTEVGEVGEIAKTLRTMHLSRDQRKSLERKLYIENMRGAVFHFHALFEQPEAWRKNNDEVVDLPCSAELPTIGFAGVLDEMSRFDMDDKAFRTGSGVQSTGRRFNMPRQYCDLTTHVPFIPKRLMPQWGTRSRHYILFDVSKWTGRIVIEDPYIVEDIGDNHYKVVSHWDLTDNEKRLMAFAMSR